MSEFSTLVNEANADPYSKNDGITRVSGWVQSKCPYLDEHALWVAP